MKLRRRYAVSTLSLAIGTLLGMGQAYAQQTDATDTPAAPAREAQTSPDEATASATTLDSVIVTVERREQNLQKYAGTAQAFSQDELRLLGINTEMRNLQVAVPGLSMSNQEGNLEIFIRGVGSANNTELGDPGAAPHVNGNYIPRPRGLGTMFYDLERVEINKGPQGTLRGRNALAGTLNIVTKRPELGGEFSGYAEAEAGNRSTEGFQLGLNFPLGDYAALRFAGYSLEKDSSFVNAGLGGQRPAGIQDEQAGRLSFLYEPDDKLSVFAMLDFGRELGTGYPGANIYGAAREGFAPDDIDLRQVVYTGPQGTLDSTGWGFQGNIAYDFGGITLEYNGSYRDVEYNQVNANSAGVNWPGRDLSAQGPDGTGGGVNYDSFSTVYWQTLSQSQVHEVRLFSDDQARFRWTAGGFYFHEEQQVGFFSLADRGVFYSGTEFTMPDVDGKSTAVFADGTFDVSDAFRVKGGVRYTKESKSRYGIGGNWTIGLGSEGFGCCFNVRLGTEGFRPALTDRPNFDVSGLTTNADFARFLLQGILTPGARDTLVGNLAGVIDGTRPNGTCIDRPDNGGGALDCPADGQHSFFALGIPAQQFGESEFDFFDWRLGLEYDLGERNLVYATVSTGHKAGGFNDSFDVDEIPETFEPESIIALEVGSKNSFDFLGNVSTFNVSGFYYDYSDQVFQDLAVIAVNPQGEATGFALVNRNVGKSVLYGLEAESRLNLGSGFGLNLNALYLETEVKEGVVADVRSQNFGAGGITSQIDLSGNELPLSSKYTLNAQLTHSFDTSIGTFDWQILGSYRSDFYLTQYNDRDVVFVSDTAGTVDRIEDAATAGFPDQQEGYTQVNAGLGWTSLDGAVRVEAYGSNLTNKDVSQKALVGSGINVRFLNDARAYGLRVRYRF
jgi:iron complex outermembrane receptor protein